MPAAEREISVDLARALLHEQHPDLAERPLRPRESGWDNAIFQIGDDLVMRLPRREVAVAALRNEQRWLPSLAERLPLPIPVPVRVGVPGARYDWPFSICPWFEGESAADGALDARAAARDLGAFLRALHVPAPEEAPKNEVRGGALSGRGPALEERLRLLGDRVDGDAIRARFARAVAVPRDPSLRLWLHGDLHPANLVTRAGRLAAVIDFGDLTAGDPATDLAAAWMLFDRETRPGFREAAGAADDATWARARGWALSHAVAVLASSADNPRMHAVGARTLARVLDDPDG
ncbi:MAG: aminoglycoside phosphotransferase family protein [Myxococcota bacterium]|nr:aminoglycoside phosphotransferase family protein [Myxococcota bacterium]